MPNELAWTWEDNWRAVCNAQEALGLREHVIALIDVNYADDVEFEELMDNIECWREAVVAEAWGLTK